MSDRSVMGSAFGPLSIHGMKDTPYESEYAPKGTMKENALLKLRLEKLELVREAALELKGVSNRLDRALDEADCI